MRTPAQQRSINKLRQKLEKDVQYRMLVYARKRARETGVRFDLKKEDIEIPLACPILGVDFEYKTYYTYSIDRIEPELGYVKGNIQVISHKANAMKNSATKEELITFAKWVLRTYGDPESIYQGD